MQNNSLSKFIFQVKCGRFHCDIFVYTKSFHVLHFMLPSFPVKIGNNTINQREQFHQSILNSVTEIIGLEIQ